MEEEEGPHVLSWSWWKTAGGGEEILLQPVLYGWRESWADEHHTTQLSPSVKDAAPVTTLG